MNNYVNATDLLPITFNITLPPNPRVKITTNSQISPKTKDDNKNSKVPTMKIFLDSNASASTVRKDVLKKRLKDRNSKWSTMTATSNTTLLTGLNFK